MKLEFCRNCGKRITHFAPDEKVVDGYYCACTECEQDFYSFETIVVETKNHIEISDGDTLILSVENCNLDILDKSLLVENTPCCVKGKNFCKNFYKYISSEKGNFIQCTLNGIDEENNVIFLKGEKNG
jgi:hypothetical protein